MTLRAVSSVTLGWVAAFLALQACSSEGGASDGDGIAGWGSSTASTVSLRVRESRLVFPYGSPRSSDVEEEFEVVVGNHGTTVLSFDEIHAVFYADDAPVSASTYFEFEPGRIKALYSVDDSTPPARTDSVAGAWHLEPHTGQVIALQSANSDYGRRFGARRSVRLTLYLRQSRVHGPDRIELEPAR